MSFPERSVAVLGPGLLGGSILRDIKKAEGTRVLAYARRKEAVIEIEQLGLADEVSTDLGKIVSEASFIVLGSPVGSYPQLCQALAQQKLSRDVLVTDVGSVKGAVLATAEAILAPAGIPFIGSHPMAGKEQSGLAASQEALFQKSVCILTPTPGTLPEHLHRVEAFWRALGSRVVSMDAAQHDHTVARVSHLPHLAAVSVVLASLEAEPHLADFAAGGLRDTTRVASGPPAMWQEILLSNRENILAGGRELISKISQLLELLEQNEAAPLEAWLAKAKQLRDNRYERK
jgi:prephenate dehydrogenase